MERKYKIIRGCCLQAMAALAPETIDLTITSPPYFKQKNYEDDRQIGWERTRDDYLQKMSRFLEDLRRLTSPSGSAFVIVGDSYRDGSMQLIPHRLACIAGDAGWSIRNDLIWWKTDAAPGKTPNRWRFTHEHILFLTKSPNRYFFDDTFIRQPYSERTLKRWGKGQRYGGPKSQLEYTNSSEKEKAKGNKFNAGRSFVLNPTGTLPPDVISLPSGRSALQHYATFPLSLATTLTRVASHPDGLVFDPFMGTGTTGEAALAEGRRFLGIELRDVYADLAETRLSGIVAARRTRRA